MLTELLNQINPVVPRAVVKPASIDQPLCVVIHKQILVSAYQNKVDLGKRSFFKSNINIVPTDCQIKLVGIFPRDIALKIAEDLYSDTLYRDSPENPFDVLGLPVTGIINPDYDC